MKTRFSYEGDSVIEIIRDGDDVEVVVRPAAEFVEDELPIDTLAIAQPLGEAEPVAPKKGRGLPAFIRGAWTFLIAVFVEGGSYLVNNLTAINLPPGIGLVAGAGLQGAIYGAKKFVAPDSLI